MQNVYVVRYLKRTNIIWNYCSLRYNNYISIVHISLIILLKYSVLTRDKHVQEQRLGEKINSKST